MCCTTGVIRLLYFTWSWIRPRSMSMCTRPSTRCVFGMAARCTILFSPACTGPWRMCVPARSRSWDQIPQHMLATADGMAIDTTTGEIRSRVPLAWGAPGAGRRPCPGRAYLVAVRRRPHRCRSRCVDTRACTASCGGMRRRGGSPPGLRPGPAERHLYPG